MEDDSTVCTVRSCCSDSEAEDHFDLTVCLLGPKGLKIIMDAQYDLPDPWGLLGNPGKQCDDPDENYFSHGSPGNYHHQLGLLVEELSTHEKSGAFGFGTEIRKVMNLLDEDRVSLKNLFKTKDKNFLDMKPDAILELVKEAYEHEIVQLPEKDFARRAIEIVVDKAESMKAYLMQLLPQGNQTIKATLYVAYTLLPAFKSLDSSEENVARVDDVDHDDDVEEVEAIYDPAPPPSAPFESDSDDGIP